MIKSLRLLLSIAPHLSLSLSLSHSFLYTAIFLFTLLNQRGLPRPSSVSSAAASILSQSCLDPSNPLVTPEMEEASRLIGIIRGFIRYYSLSDVLRTLISHVMFILIVLEVLMRYTYVN